MGGVAAAAVAAVGAAVSAWARNRSSAPTHAPGERERRQHEEERRRYEERAARLQAELAEERQREAEREQQRQQQLMEQQARERQRLAELAAQREQARLEEERQRQEREEQEKRHREALQASQEKQQRLLAEAERVNRERAEAERHHREEQERIAKEWPKPLFFQGYEKFLNAAMIGQTGTGKSSLINRVLGLSGAKRARVGVQECTQEATPFSSDTLSFLTLWDLPGAGTERFPRASYIKQMGIRYFDCLVIVTGTRFTEIDCMLFREARAHDIPVFLVRSKADVDLENNEEDNGMAPQQTVRLLKNSMHQDLVRNSNGQPVDRDCIFVVSAKPDLYAAELGPEFDALTRKIYDVASSRRAPG